jgi:hypothetical protein
MGTRLALVKSLSQMRHPEGKTTLMSASLISDSQPLPCRVRPGTLARRAAAMPLDELLSATPAQSTLLIVLIKEGMYVAVT